MSLGDPLYFGFLAVVFLFYYLLAPGCPRRVLLIGSSYFFYFELSKFYLLVLFFITLVTYHGALILRSSQTARRGALFFWLIVAVVLAPLIVFKYLSPLLELGGRAFPMVHAWGAPLLGIALPIGISFFTFAALGYLIDVYLEVIEPERSFGRIALFLAFFPLVSAGPIERAGRFISQFDLETKFSAERTLLALRCILMGLVLKVVLANMLAGPVNKFYATPAAFHPFQQLSGIIYFSFYLYADFAGYSLIAIGSARLFGLDVRPNFLQPFLSATVPEYWRNWHISLSSWVRDYLFAPLRMEWRRYGNGGMAGALLVSFIVLGAWHGAKWGWIAFGLVHGLLVTASAFTLSGRNRLWASLRIPSPVIYVKRVLITFLLVTFSFVLWRASSLHEAFDIYRAIFSLDLLREFYAIFQWHLFHHGNRAALADVTPEGWLKNWMVIAIILGGDILARLKITAEKFPVVLQLCIYNVVIAAVLINWLIQNGNQSFVYYKF
jgi:alginate O-acetyltransferase complex protein AlgI